MKVGESPRCIFQVSPKDRYQNIGNGVGRKESIDFFSDKVGIFHLFMRLGTKMSFPECFIEFPVAADLPL